MCATINPFRLLLQAFSAFLDARGYRGLATAPYVYTQFSSRRLLVMERLRGSPLTDLDAIRRVTSREPEAVLIAALNTWCVALRFALVILRTCLYHRRAEACCMHLETQQNE